MKYFKYIMAVITLIIAVSAGFCEPKKAVETDFLLDTYVSVTVYGKGAKSAAKQALSLVGALDKKLSAFYEGSDVHRINTANKNTPVQVSPECFYLIKQALVLSEQTDGAFDITIKPVVDLWGFGTTPQVPSYEQLSSFVSKVDYRAVLLDEENQTVTLTKEGMAIDLGGIAKGYCADRAADVLQQAGIKNAYLDFGGNIVTLGKRPLGLFDRIRYRQTARPFVVGIQNPAGARGEVAETYTVHTDRCAIVTSGNYERFFEQDGKRYHHILDPKTGRQPEHDIVSTTVIGASSEVCDALSTAFFVSGGASSKELNAHFYETILITDTGERFKIYSQGEQ